MMDIGCSPITTWRFIFGAEPTGVAGLIEFDPDFKTDRLASVMMEFPSGQSVFTCTTQLVHYQRMQFLGTAGLSESGIPFYTAPERPPTSTFVYGPERLV